MPKFSSVLLFPSAVARLPPLVISGGYCSSEIGLGGWNSLRFLFLIGYDSNIPEIDS